MSKIIHIKEKSYQGVFLARTIHQRQFMPRTIHFKDSGSYQGQFVLRTKIERTIRIMDNSFQEQLISRTIHIKDKINFKD